MGPDLMRQCVHGSQAAEEFREEHDSYRQTVQKRQNEPVYPFVEKQPDDNGQQLKNCQRQWMVEGNGGSIYDWTVDTSERCKPVLT